MAVQRIPMDKLISNVREGKVSREIYIEEIVRGILNMPLCNLANSDCKETKKHVWYSVDEMLKILGFPDMMHVSDEFYEGFRYGDLVTLVGNCLEMVEWLEPDVSDKIYDLAEPLGEAIKSIHKRAARHSGT